MDYVEMLFIKMSSEAVIPTRATEHSVGLRLYNAPPAAICRYQHKSKLKSL